MIPGIVVGHSKTQDDFANDLIVVCFRVYFSPITSRPKNQFVVGRWIDLACVYRFDQTTTRIRFAREDASSGPVLAYLVEHNADTARMCSINPVQDMRRDNGHHSIEALSRLSDVAATIGLITPLHLTLTHAVLPLAIAR